MEGERPKKTEKFLILFFPSGLPWIPNTSSSVYYRKTKREGKVKIIIILYIYFFVKAYLDLFFPTQQSTTLLTTHTHTHTLEEGKTRFLLVCNGPPSSSRELKQKGKEERGQRFSYFVRRSLSDPSPLPFGYSLIVLVREREKREERTHRVVYPFFSE